MMTTPCCNVPAERKFGIECLNAFRGVDRFRLTCTKCGATGLRILGRWISFDALMDRSRRSRGGRDQS